MKDQDRQIVNRLKSAIKREKKEPIGGINHYFIEEKVLPIIYRLDKQSTAMLALLGRWVEQFSFPDLSSSSNQKYHQQEIINDTKTLLREVEEMK